MNCFSINTGHYGHSLRVFILLACLLPGMQVWAANNPVAAAAPPNWTINPADFEFNMNLTIRITYNGVLNNGNANMIGVFVGNELRGVAAATMIGGVAYFFTTVYSNNYVGETVHFRAYYAADDAVYGTGETEIFLHNKEVGNTQSAYFVNINPNEDFPPALDLVLEDTTLQNIPFDAVNLNNYLFSADGDPVTWFTQPGPNLSATIVNGVLTVTPLSNAWTGTDSVRIIVRENTANQLADTITGWFTVLEDYGFPVWQYIPDQTIFPGGQFTSFDLDDHLNFNGPCHAFDFDVFPYTGAAPDPVWPPLAPGAQPMSIIARPVFADEQLAGSGARLAAFINNVLAGSAGPTGVPPNVSYPLSLNNVGAGPIKFRFYDAANQYLYEEPTTLIYAAGTSVGTIAAPYMIQLSPLVPTLTAGGAFEMIIDDPTWIGTYPVDFIVWDCNLPDTRRDTIRVNFSVVSDIRPEITSASSVNFEENACNVLYDTQSSDPNNSEGAGLTYSLAGGTDAARFQINAQSGVLSWATGFTPDFEMPADANADNHYQVNIRVVNAANLSDTLALTVIITNQTTEPFAASINGGVTPLCISSSVTLQAAGGVSYLWSNGSTLSSIVVSTPGTYTVTATSSGTCTASASVLVAQPPTISASGSVTPICVGAPVQLGSTPSSGTMPYNFSWTGPNNFTATVEDPAGFPALAASAGIYTVIVTDNAGCTASATTSISVSGNSAPAISASGNSPVCENAQIVLNSVPSGGSGVYQFYNWQGPNSYVSLGQAPAPFTASLAAAGQYSVTVTDNAGCSAVGTTTIQVNPRPNIVAGSNSPVSTGSNILLNSTTSGGSGGGYAYVWSGPDNYASNQAQPAAFSATAASAGTYIVTVTDGNTCSNTSSTTVLLAGCPSISAALGGTVCAGGNIVLQSTATGGSLPYNGFAWSGPNNFTSNLEDPTPFAALPGTAGTYTVTVTDHLGCAVTASVNVVLNAAPAISASNNGPMCAGGTVILSSTPSGGSGIFTAFNWTGPDNFGASSEDPAPFTGTASATGTYLVKVTDNQGCTATATTVLTVNSKPLISASSNSPLCVGGTLSLQSTPSSGSGVYSTFQWSGPAAFSSALEDPTPFQIQAMNAGVYTVTVTDNAGCSGTSSTVVSVSGNPAPSISASSNSPVCAGSNLTLNATPSGGSGVYTGFQWVGPNSYAASQQNPSPFQVFSSGAGVYTVTVTDSKNCKASASVSVVVSGPAVSPSSNSPVCPGANILLNAGASGVSYAWAGPNNYSSNQANPPGFPATLATAGTYTVSVTDANGCTNTGTVTVTTGDAIPPVITCPANTTVAANAVCGGMLGSFSPLSLSDNCSANPAVTQNPAASTTLTGHNDSRTVTLTANDGNGNTANCTFTVTLKDVTKPLMVCPANTTLAANAVCAGTLGSFSPLSLSDNCAANAALTQNPAASTALSGHNDVETVTLTANDGNGNTEVCTFTVTLKDVTKPVIVCPANTTVAANAVCAGALGSFSPLSLSDNCATNPTLTQSPAASTVLSGHNDVKTVTLTADDGNGNTQFCTFSVTLKDVTKPVIVCPDNTTVAANAVCAGTLGSFSPLSLSDNCSANPTLTQSPAASTLLSGHNDMETVTLTANDGNGNSEACTFTVTLKDVTKPLITCPANTTVAANAVCAGTLGSFSPLFMSDNCSANPTLTQSPAASTILSGHNDVETVTLTANDGNGNTQFCTFTVTLKDVTKPVITCPANTTIAADANCSGVVGTYAAISVSDNCNPNPTVTQSPAASTVLSGHNDVENVTLTADDGNGNTQFCTFTVTLKDVTKPVITCPANTTVAANAVCGGTLGSFSPLSMSDNCSANPILTQSPAASTVLSGHNDVKTVTLTADDGNGNTQFCTFTVTLKDITPPTVVCKPFTSALNAAGMSSITTGNVFQSGADNCGTVNQVSVVPSAFTCSNLGPNTVLLTVNDGNGNSATCNAVVTVVDLIAPTMLCKPFSVYLNAAGTASVTAAQINNGSSDKCTLSSLSAAPTSFTCANLGSNAVILMATDQSGNTATCQSIVTVIDTIKPTMICKPATLNLNNAGQATLTVAAINNGSFDNCSIATLSLSQTIFTCANLGNNTVKLIGTDPSGNSAFCTTTVTVQDLIAPIARCKDATVNLNAAGSVTVLASAVDNASSDNCSFSLNMTPSTFTCANLGINTVTLKATDGSGNTGTCTAKITVKDVTKPVALCKNITVFLNDVGKVTINPLQADNGSSDNCSIVTKSLSTVQFNCSDIGAPVSDFLTVTDASGNSATCTAMITVKDNLAPTAKCKNATVPLVNGLATVYGAVLADSSFDNCSVWSFSPSAKSYIAVGQYNLVITVKDFSGNAATCTSVVTVIPNFGSSDPDYSGPNKILQNVTSLKPSLNMDLSPNPAKGDVQVKFELPADQSFQYMLHSLTGKMMLTEKGEGKQGSNSVSVKLDHVSAGIYLLELRSGSLRSVLRLMVE